MKVAEPPLAEALATAIDHLKHERLDSAEPALLGVLERWPGQPDALHFLGVLRRARYLRRRLRHWPVRRRPAPLGAQSERL